MEFFFSYAVKNCYSTDEMSETSIKLTSVSVFAIVHPYPSIKNIILSSYGVPEVPCICQKSSDS